MARSKPRAPEPTNLKGFARYWRVSQHPLQCLIFLAPFIFIYELGTILWAHDPLTGTVRVNFARALLNRFFEWFGVTGYYLPGLIVVVVLLTWHIVKRDPWKLEPQTYPLMLAESVALALPLIVLLRVLGRQFVPAMATSHFVDEGSLRLQLVFSTGAGIYEEMLFRLIGIALLHMIFVDILGLPDRVGTGVTIALTSVAFAFYHFVNAGEHPFSWVLVLQYSLAGGYFAAIYIVRGFGVVAGTHASYDVIVTLMQHLA